MIDPPRHLTPEGRKIFHETCNRVASDSRDPERFAGMIAMYAQAHAEWQMLSASVLEEGVVITTSSGRMIANPRIQVRDAAHQRMERLMEALGLSPNSPIAKDDVWDPDTVETLDEIEAEMAEEAGPEAPIDDADHDAPEPDGLTNGSDPDE
jgi:P27 family predicted phage terminase small subunit